LGLLKKPTLFATLFAAQGLQVTNKFEDCYSLYLLVCCAAEQ